MTGYGLGFLRFPVDTLSTGLQADRTGHFTPSEDRGRSFQSVTRRH
jgi:hypothetical protein